MGGVNLGDYCVVGANSVVTHSFPAGSVIAGAPARLVKTLDTPQP
jgi:acetyltransferase-like isoleucine patch superfamily enzyme